MSRGFWLSALCLVSHSALATPPAATEGTPRSVVRDCQLSLWGCSGPAGGSTSGPYDQVIAKARSQIQAGQIEPGKNVASTIAELVEATRQRPDRHEGLALLAMYYAETAACSDGMPLFSRLLAFDDPPSGSATPSPVLSWRERQTIQLGLALCLSRRGDHAQAVSLYQRLLLGDGPSQRVLYRLGDALLAQGLTDDAVRAYRQACLDVPPLPPLWNLARSCVGLLVALDRSHQRAPSRVFAQLRRQDPMARYLKMSDFLWPAEPDYYRALTVPAGCERESRLLRYLQAADATIPRAYRQRAEEHLATTRAQHPGCNVTTGTATNGPGSGAAVPPLPPTDDVIPSK